MSAVDDIMRKVDELEEAAKASRSELNDLLSFSLQSIVLTHDYVGSKTLPPIDGWSWFDACKKIALEIPEDPWTAQFIIRQEFCPNCKSGTGIKIPRDSSPYCEDCGFPFEVR